MKSRFAPPVHIPPRKPLYDPGLPESLNGKFNPTQQIRGNGPFLGQRAVIGDVRQDETYTSNQRRNGGLQGKISRLINRQQSSPVGTGAIQQPPRQSALQNRLQQSVASAVDNHQPRPRLTQTQPPATVQQPTPSKRVAARPNQTVQKTYPVARRASVNNAYKNTQPPRSVSIPVQVANNPKRAIRKAAMQEPAERFANDLTQPFQQEPEPVQAWNDSKNFAANSEVITESRPPMSGREFLPNAQSLPETQPISVMTGPDNGLTLEPESVPESFESAPSFENSSYVPMENSLREPLAAPERIRRTYQEEQNESVIDSDLRNQDPEPRSEIRQKSCEEFRAKLLTTPITAIPLDISPPARTDILGANPNRVWRDDDGNELAEGTIADIRRGYVIVNAAAGGQVRLPYARLSEADWKAISEYWVLPEECGLGQSVFMGRNWIPQTVNWHASSLCHKPLYFENIQLERYGHSAGPILQPILSTGHFFERTFFLPYNTAINPPTECQYALGFYRPGDCAPWLKAPFPISLSGAARQALFWTGLGVITN